MPSVTGNYQLRATYEGDDNYLGTHTIVNMAVTQYAEENVFSVTSNSTVTSLMFESANKELRFTVSGDSGTTGYADVYIAKTLVQDASSMGVHLDENKIDYTLTSTDDSWLLHFVYSHSSHNVTISLGSSSWLDGNLLGNWMIYIAIAAIAVIIVVAAVVLKKRKSKNRKGFREKSTNGTH
jgi:hypothetical protein